MELESPKAAHSLGDIAIAVFENKRGAQEHVTKSFLNILARRYWPYAFAKGFSLLEALCQFESFLSIVAQYFVIVTF